MVCVVGGTMLFLRPVSLLFNPFIYDLAYMTVLIALAILIWVVAFLLKWNLPAWLGRSGENFVSRKLHSLDPRQYTVLDDLMLPSHGNIATTQVDHVVVSNYGIFCIETKSYKGWIFANAQQQYWTQVIYRYRKKFYNPLRQNFAHTKAIEEILKPKFPHAPIHGFVAFPSAEKLQVTGTNAVGRATEVVAKIEAIMNPVISDSDRDAIVQILRNANIEDKNARRVHNQSAHALKRAKGW
jgi:hypothetical protein